MEMKSRFVFMIVLVAASALSFGVAFSSVAAEQILSAAIFGTTSALGFCLAVALTIERAVKRITG